MRSRLFCVYLVLAFASGYVSAMWPHSEIVGNTCQQAAKANYDDCSSQEGECLCDNQNYMATVAQCIQSALNTTLSIDSGWDFVIITSCRKSAEESNRLYKLTQEYLNQTELTFLPADYNRSEVFNTPLVFDHDSLKDIYKSVHINLENKDISVWQGSVLIMMWAFVIAVASLSNFLRFIAYKFASRRQVMSRPSKIMRLYQQHILIPACFGTKHIDRVYLMGSIPLFIPTRMESIVILVYGLVSFLFLCGGYKTMDDNPLWATHYSAVVLNLSNRAGIIATIQIPLLTLFALRNNVLIWATGWSFSTFNAYHRAIARITYLHLIIHAVGKQLMMMTFHIPLAKILYPSQLYKLGVTALALMAVMIFFSFLRSKMYEVFLAVHVAGAFAAYITTIYHLDGLGYKQAIYVSLGLWAGDWLIRIIRMIFINIAIFLDPVTGSGRLTQAHVSIFESEVISVKIRTPIKWTVTPGQYVFIHFSRYSIFQSHPFSVVGPSDDGESFQLMCKARGGITGRIYRHLTASPKNSKYPEIMPVIIEGPYGAHCPVERYDTVILVAGGIGITGIIPYVEFLIEHGQNQQHIVLIWTVGVIEEFGWIKDRLQKISRTGKVELRLYMTRAAAAADVPAEPSSPFTTVYVHDDIQPESPQSRHQHAIHDPFNTESKDDHLTFELEEVSISSDSGRATQPVERKRASFYKHIKSMSQGSARFHVDPTHRSENVDGNEMVEWPGPIHTHAHDLRQNLKRFTSNDPANPRFQLNPYSESQQYKDPHFRATMSSLKYSPRTSIVNVPRLSSFAWAEHIQQGRPNLLDTIAELFMGASGSIAVVGCGPAKMMDTLRQAVSLHLEVVPHGRADYFEEAFTW